MLTLDRMREAVRFSGPIALDWTSNDIQEALRNARAMQAAGMLTDERRISEYHDELCIVATVRRELQDSNRKPCPCCGRV